MDTLIFYYTIKIYDSIGYFWFNCLMAFNILLAIILGVYVYESLK